MNSTIFFFIFVPILSIILLSINFILATHKPYKEKKTPFECGYHSFLSQNRTQFTISFFIFALLFLIFDLEIVLIYPVTVSSYFNTIYGIIVVIIFVLILTLGFVFELGKRALTIYTVQTFKVLYSMIPVFFITRYLLKKNKLLFLIFGIFIVILNYQYEILESALDLFEINLINDSIDDNTSEMKLNYMTCPIDGDNNEVPQVDKMTGGRNVGSSSNTAGQENQSSDVDQQNQENQSSDVNQQNQENQSNINDERNQSNINNQENNREEVGESSRKRKRTDFYADAAATRAESQIAQENLLERISNVWGQMDKTPEEMSKEEYDSYNAKLDRIFGEHYLNRVRQMSDYTKFLESEEQEEQGDDK